MTATLAHTRTYGTEAATVVRGGVRILQEVTCRVDAGTVTAVVGGDGAGKTTLLRLLAGTVEPDGGRVDRPSRGRIGAILGPAAVHADLTVQENLDFVAAAYGLDPAARREGAARLLSRVGLDHASDRLAGALSGGMRQKLAVALAMLHGPQLLVLDEPTTGVDPVSRADVWRLLADAAADGIAIVVSTTYLDEAERAERIVLLDGGRVLLGGDRDALVATVGGRFGTLVERPDPDLVTVAWRHSQSWRCWVSEGGLPAGADAVTPTLDDVAIAAQVREGRS